MKRFLALVVSMLALFSISACSASGSSKTIVIATASANVEATKQLIAELEGQAKSHGWKSKTVSSSGDLGELNKSIQDELEKKPAAVVIVSSDPAALGDGIQAAAAENVPVYAVNAAAPKGISANIGSSLAGMGSKLADMVRDVAPSAKNVVVVASSTDYAIEQTSSVAESRLKSLGFNVVETRIVDAGAGQDAVRDAVAEVIKQGVSFDAVVAGWDEGVLGSAQALEDAGKKDVAVVGVAGTDSVKAKINADGVVRGVVSQDLPQIAAKAFEVIAAYVEKGTVPSSPAVEIDTKTLVVS